MKKVRKYIDDAINAVMAGDDVICAVKYVEEKLIVRARRRLYNGKIARGNTEILITIGKPNFTEREFIRKCKEAKEPFPVKKIQIKWVKSKAEKYVKFKVVCPECQRPDKKILIEKNGRKNHYRCDVCGHDFISWKGVADEGIDRGKK